jgi:hypothetical protein
VPVAYRKLFGCTEVRFSLTTASEVEANRLEKQHDVEFDERLQAARIAGGPHAVGAQIAEATRLEIGSVNPF